MPAVQIESFEFQYLKDCNLGGRLRFFRQKMIKHHGSDYTITSLGSRLGVTPQSISAIEREDSKNPSFRLVHQLTQEFRVPLESVTDEFYFGKERLFSIGIPVSVSVDFDIDDLDDLTLVDEEEDDYFNFDEIKGVLIYHCMNRNEIVPLYHTQFKDDISDDEMEHFISRLLLETTNLTTEKFVQSKAIHPLQEANQIIKRYNKFLTPEELLDLLVNKNNK
ncbi:helix-turn-helix domain-containing protein [Oceanobacillus kimchii]|uniref:helix-turn-helix domain-containing protein n=1 Tax=Oceanobacillus kimchii TaxID=746691 RepID=UPI0021A8A37D|nr:helix-turn-helix domain-containing protein [Oceanobacillus kimchii]MCT1577065.1 helix-turn-helix domain-containing protein [Oceanobacillus kimchii]MCT2135135.1 helix-turn-helix domain-containing protein [Oceanobacillus kimchii]